MELDLQDQIWQGQTWGPTCRERPGSEPGEEFPLQRHPLLLPIIVQDLVALVVRVKRQDLSLHATPNIYSNSPYD